MPADSIPAAHSALTEMAAHPVSKSSLKRDYTIPYPSERDFMLARSRHNSIEARNVRDGSNPVFQCCPEDVRFTSNSDRRADIARSLRGAN